MPIKIIDNLPAKEILRSENIFVMDESRAFHQDIRPLKIIILNLMPTKQDTEVQLLRLIGNTPLQIEIRLMHMESHISKNTPSEYLMQFYTVFSEVCEEKFDGMIITGAPVEMLDFKEISYWNELTQVMEWTKTNVTSTFHICWAAQAGLYYHYGIEKHKLEKKVFGIFPHVKTARNKNILRGFDDVFYAPQSRHTEILRSEIEREPRLKILAESTESGVYIVESSDEKNLFITGHSEYDPNTLKTEYLRDIERGLNTEVPRHYFKDDNPANDPIVNWRAHASLLYSNWLNYYVYQQTPYNL